MACYQPIHGFRAPGGLIKMSRSGAYRDRPITVPCGQCIGCRLEKSRQWATRIMHEASLQIANSFLTLTYNDAHLPDDQSVNVKHFQKFAKRMRKAGLPFRYFHCGEYGDKTGRPHYHLACFNQDFADDRQFYKLTDGGNRLYTSKLLDDLWGMGQCWIGDLTFDSAAYVARYCMKKITGPDAEMRYGGVDEITGECLNPLKPEYATMSRRPGLGKGWLDKFHSDVYPSDEVIIRGHSTKPPKFYDQQLSDPELKKIQDRRAIKALRRKHDSTPDRLEVREVCAKAKLTKLKRH